MAAAVRIGTCSFADEARVPDGFVIHVKAFAPMTRHPVRLERARRPPIEPSPTPSSSR